MFLADLNSGNMTQEEIKRYIQEQRAKVDASGNRLVPDEKILEFVNNANKPAEQRGFAGELVPTAFSIAGGLVGGRFGGVPGAIGLSSAGGALGETIQQKIEKTTGTRQEYSGAQIASQGVISGLFEGGGLLISKGGSMALNAARPTFVKGISKLSGFSDDVVNRVMTRTKGVVQGAKEGDKELAELVTRSAQGLDKFAKQTLAESRKKIAEFSKQAVSGAMPGTKQTLLQESKNFMKSITDILRSQQNRIGVKGDGTLLFDRLKESSNIVSRADREAIQSAYNEVRSVLKTPEIRHIDAVLERLITLGKKTPSGGATGPETKRIIGQMGDELVTFVKSVPPKFGRGYAEYVKHLEETLPVRVMIGDAKEIFGKTANPSPVEITRITKRLLGLFENGAYATREAVEGIGKKVGEDIMGTTAGTIVKGGVPSGLTPGVSRTGLIEQAFRWAPKAIVNNYARTGKITGDARWFINTAKTLGISVKALMQEFVNLTANKTNK